MLIRCSATDRALACASSLATPEHPYTPQSEDAAEGHAGHEALAAMVVGRGADLAAIAARHHVNEDDLAILVARGRQAWAEIAPMMRGTVHVEHPLQCDLGGDVFLRGTADVIAIGDDAEITIADWKLGHAPSEHSGQLASYAFAAARMYGPPASGYVTTIEIWVRAGEIRVNRPTLGELTDHAERLVAQVRRIGREYGPGATSCRYCPHQQACPARAEWLRGSVSALAPLAEGELVTPTVLGSLYDRAKQLRAALAQYDDALDDALARGPVPLGEGRQLVVEDVEQDKLRPSLALDYVGSLFPTPDELDAAMSVPKGAIEKLVKARAPKGQGAARWREAMQDLARQGAVEKTTVRRKKVEAIND
jgi:RecB family exonuclease